MPLAHLLHNPKAGDKDHTEEKLVAQIAVQGYTCVYSSTKEEGWENIHPDADIVVIIGGDGTVRKVTRVLLNRGDVKQHLLAILPMGTANNIAGTLKIKGSVNQVIQAWKNRKTSKMDVGIVSGLPEPNFFIEGFGYGIFPQLMLDMKKVDKKKLNTPEKEISKALEMLRDITLNFEAKYCRVVVDGQSYTGNYLLAEVMNICSVGPKLRLAPAAKHDDGVFEVVLIPEKQRQQFADLLLHTLNGTDRPPFAFETISGKDIEIKWDDTVMHADDELIEVKESLTIKIAVETQKLRVLTTG